MSDILLSNPTTQRRPHPLGRRVKIGNLLSGLESNCDGGTSSGSATGSLLTQGWWGNVSGLSLVTLGYMGSQGPVTACQNAVILTEHAPITKGYGDAQLAGVDDVTVVVDGSEVTPLHVDAPAGIIILHQELAVNTQVSVSYHYTPNPTLELAGLNNSSYLLNQWSRRDYTPFTFNTVLGPHNRPQPKQYEYRYRGLDYPYTSVLNDPTSMVMNEPKHRLTLAQFERQNQSASVFFEGDKNPEDFEFKGPALEPATIENGLYVIEDVSTSDNVIGGNTAFFRKEIDLTFDHASILNFRMEIETWTLDGDFTGVAAGYADDSHLHLIGFLEIGDFKTVGLLKDPEDESKWESYAGLQTKAVEHLVGGTPTLDLLEFNEQPPLVEGQRVFIEGDIFEIVDIDESQTTPGKWEVYLDGEVGAVGTYTLFPEIDWTDLKTYRVFKNEKGKINVLVGGNVLPVASLDQNQAAIAPEIFEVLENNSLFFGGISRKTSSKSLWDFVRYSILPTSDIEQDARISVDTEFNTLPENDPNDPWYLTDNQGYAKLFANEHLLTQSAGQQYVGGAINHTRIEPFLTSKSILDLSTSFRVHSYATGMPAFVTVADDKKEVTLALFDQQAVYSYTDAGAGNLLTKGFWAQADANSLQTRGYGKGYNETPTDRFLAAYGGVQAFDGAGWSDSIDSDELSFYDHFMRVEHDGVGTSASFENTGKGAFTDVIIGARLRFDEYTALGDGRLPVFFGNSGGTAQIYLMPFDDGTKKIVFCDETGSVVFDGPNPVGFEFDWDDEEFHHYKVVRYGGNVTVFVDGQYQAVFDTNTLPNDTGTDPRTRLAFLNGQVDVDVDFFFAHSAVYNTRRVGVYKGGDLLDASNYDFVDTEWLGTFMDMCIRRDPTGTTKVFLNNQTTPVFELQYEELPDRRNDRFNTNTDLGYVQFGTNDPQAYSEVLWDYVRYDIINQRENQKANNQSYLNRHNVITSPEPIIDEDPETVVVESATSNLVRLSQTEMYARNVLAVMSEDGTLTYPFTYDFESNTIGITGSGLPSEQETLKVVFYHRKPYTEAYLENNWAYTRLNEDTPPVPLGQQVDLESEEGFASAFNDPNDVLNTDEDFVFNDANRTIRFTKNDEAFYESLKMLRAEDAGGDGLLSLACDEDGLREITFEGPFSEEEYELPDQGDEDTRHGYRIGYFNRPTSTFNDIQTNTVGIQSPVSLEVHQTEEETYKGTANDQAPTGAPYAVLEDFYGSATFNNPKTTMSRVTTTPGDVHEDSVIATANTVTQTDYPVDYTSTILYP